MRLRLWNSYSTSVIFGAVTCRWGFPRLLSDINLLKHLVNSFCSSGRRWNGIKDDFKPREQKPLGRHYIFRPVLCLTISARKPSASALHWLTITNKYFLIFLIPSLGCAKEGKANLSLVNQGTQSAAISVTCNWWRCSAQLPTDMTWQFTHYAW